MLWARRRPEASGEAVPAAVSAAEPHFAQERFEHHLKGMLEAADACGGVDAMLAALEDKHARVAESVALGPGDDLEPVAALLGRVFTARRRLYPALERAGARRVRDAIGALTGGASPLLDRIHAFVDMLPGAEGTDRESLRAAARVRRAGWDFAAELLHYSAPHERPLMSRWVWDAGTQSGAVREFLAGHETVTETGIGGGEEAYTGVREWLAARIRATGVYRDLHHWVDLLLAQAYVGYVRVMTEGHLGADFGRGTSPHEQLRKLLGIDAASGLGAVRRAAAGD